MLAPDASDVLLVCHVLVILALIFSVGVVVLQNVLVNANTA